MVDADAHEHDANVNRKQQTLVGELIDEGGETCGRKETLAGRLRRRWQRCGLGENDSLDALDMRGSQSLWTLHECERTDSAECDRAA